MTDTDRESRGHLLALDLGSSSLRAVVLGVDYAPVEAALARRPVVPDRDGPGSATLDADRIVAAVSACLDELRDNNLIGGVTRIAVSCQWHSLVAVGRNGQAVTPVFTWADSRADPATTADDERLHQRTGAWHRGLYWTCKIPWLRHRLGATRVRFLGLAEYVTARLCSDDSCSVSMASGTGLLNLEEMDWDEEACRIAGVRPSDLPAIAREGTTSKLTSEHRSRWPDLADAPWTPAVGDGAASNVGAGCGDNQRVSLTVGTSAAVRIVESAPDAAPLSYEHWRYRVDSRRVITGIAYPVGGNIGAWSRGMLGPDVETQLEKVVPGSHGLSCLPFHLGSRPPAFLPQASGVLAGLSLQTTAAHIVAAAMEGVCIETERGLRSLEHARVPPPEVVLNGGAIHDSPWWPRAYAALIGKPLLLCVEREMAARGAALIADGRDDNPAFALIEADADAVCEMAKARTRYERTRELALAGRR